MPELGMSFTALVLSVQWPPGDWGLSLRKIESRWWAKETPRLLDGPQVYRTLAAEGLRSSQGRMKLRYGQNCTKR